MDDGAGSGGGGDELRIDRLQVRLPGVSAEQARGIVRDALAIVERQLPRDGGGRRVRLGAVHLRAAVPRGTPRDQLAPLIARSILGQLG
jgi:hypothetical protein